MFDSALGFLGLTKLKLILFAGLAVALGLAYWHYSNVKTERDEALGRLGAMQVQHETDKAAIESLQGVVTEWKQSFTDFQSTLNRMTEVQRESSEQVRKLNDVFAKHDLEQLSKAKPKLIESRINHGTADMFRMFERATDPVIHGPATTE